MVDFDFKNQFPLEAYVNAISRRRALEAQGEQQFNENLNRTIQNAGVIVDSIAKRNRDIAQSLAQAKVLANDQRYASLFDQPESQYQPNPQVANVMGRPVMASQTASPEGIPTPLPEPQTVMASQTPEGRQRIIQNLAMALQGNKPDDFLRTIKPEQSINLMTQVFDPEGALVSKSTEMAPKGSKLNTVRLARPGTQGPKDERTRQLAAAKVKEKAMVDINDQLGGLQQISDLRTRFKNLVASGQAGKFGTSTIKGLLSDVSKGKYYPEINSYNTLREGILARLRQITGDKGVLTDVDAQRVIKLLATIDTNPESADATFDQIDDIVAKAVERRTQTANNLINEIQGKSDITPIQSGGFSSRTPDSELQAVLSAIDSSGLSAEEKQRRRSIAIQRSREP